MKQQVVAIHGGETFETYEEYLDFLRVYEIDVAGGVKRWRTTLPESLGDDFEVILPSMPSKLNARYAEWKIWFLKYVPHLRDGVILIGHSLGGIFLAKYLSENTVSVSIRATFFISAPYTAEGSPYSLVDFEFGDASLARIAEQGGEVYLIHSTDDSVVKFADFESYAVALPDAHQMIFNDRDHFGQEEFPELVEKIKFLATSAILK